MEKLLSLMLVVHITGGVVALLTGLVAIFSTKGSATHRLAGKIYFIGMTAVFIGAIFTALGHHKDFLLMVAFFSYYMTVRGYRVLFLKKLNEGQKPGLIDWVIIIVSAIFIFTLLGWGFWALSFGAGIGIAALLFGTLGSVLLFLNVKNFSKPPKEKMRWWYSHIGSMGGSYISAVTAFVVVNVELPVYNWVLWILPGFIGGTIITFTIKKYKRQFEKA
jgi:uncharacterized membrane protein